MSYDETEDQTQHNAEAPPSDSEPVSEDANMEMDPAFITEGGKKPLNKNAVMLGGLVLVGAVVIWFMYFRGGPQTAAAGQAQANAQIKQFLDSGNINLMKEALKDTENIVKQFRQSSVGTTQIPIRSLRANPFRELAPRTDGTPIASNHADEELHAHYMTEVAALRLQSVIRGARQKACMINNTFYREGERVGDLTIVQVMPKSVIIGGGKYRFELTPESNK